MKSNDKVITVGGRKVFYWEKSPEQKEIIVLLHGYPGNYEQLMDFAESFGGKYRLIMPNFPSCGGSEPLEGENNLKNYAEWLKNFLHAISVDEAIFIGHSFGSRVALVFSATYPEKVKRSVLITPVLKSDSPFLYLLSPYYKIAKSLPPEARKKFLSNKLYEYVACKIVLTSKDNDLHKKIIKKSIKELQHVYPVARIDLFEEFCKTDLIPLGKKVKAETLIIAGEKDYLGTLKSIKELAGQIKNSSMKIMKNSGHLLPFESPDTVAKIILSWLQQL